MTEKYQLLYSEMLQDIKRTQELELPETERITACFWIAHSYWKKLKSHTDPAAFKDDNEEIEFFRTVKPQFTAHIEYFIILSEALICEPRSNMNENTFWSEELNRYKRFCQRNTSFIDYYESGERYKDSLFFLRRNAPNGFVQRPPVYDIEPEYCTSYDHLARGYLANKMFFEYCHKRLTNTETAKKSS